ncbi:MCE family protein [Mycolicibacter hiberniae]|uniref:Virulence factor n=1 Tax=Mycolicibacter hiberniae TaxID=29314 RepID=A0A7I7X760_9MYCO|nr:MCE family protein [Mycolicibacter hiberniae]BBZ25659.1 virulence factor [Mycolicibacter hiberniae]
MAMTNGPGSLLRAGVGLATVVAIGSVIWFAAQLFNGALFDNSVPVTVIADRAGLMMNPAAKVKMRDVEVGRVASIEEGDHGTAIIRLAMDPASLKRIPANVSVDISATTVFGSKYVQLTSPQTAAVGTLRAGEVIAADRVTVEVNTVFQQLNEVVSAVQPEKLNTVVTALAAGLAGRGQQLGATIADADGLLNRLRPSLPSLRHDLAATPSVVSTFADVTPDLMTTLRNSSRLSALVVDQQANLERSLLSLVGLADAGNDVIGGNRGALSDTLRLLVPTTDLLNRYNPALYCLLSGLIPLVKAPPLRLPGAEVSTGFTWGVERYRYPQDLPKVAATGGPQCAGLPVAFEKRPPYVVADTGANPYRYGNPGIVLNADGLKQVLFGPTDGPPRNSMQIGHPG